VPKTQDAGWSPTENVSLLRSFENGDQSLRGYLSGVIQGAF